VTFYAHMLFIFQSPQIICPSGHLWGGRLLLYFRFLAYNNKRQTNEVFAFYEGR
jgi:hypothetical protein